MTPRQSLSLVGLTALLWIVPSVGTQGMGTIGQQAVHPDATLVDASLDHATARVVLARADQTAETSLGF